MRALGVALLVLCLGAAHVAASSEALLGSAFADAYAQFAPLEALYRSFGDHLFAGTDIAVPFGLDNLCEDLPAGLRDLQESLVIQTTSDVVEALGAVVRLRVNMEAFCSVFASDLRGLAGTSDVSQETEEHLVAERFFASIHELDEQFEAALDAALRGTPDGEPRWALAVTFAARVLLVSAGWARVAADIAGILYGSPDAAAPPFAVPDAVRNAMAAIVAAAGTELDEEGRADVLLHALLIYEHFMRE